MLQSFTLSKNSMFYYDLEKKTIARFPSKSNLLSKGSDNSLYFGMIKNDNLVKLLLNFFDNKKIVNLNGKNFSMKCGHEDVDVLININQEGQFQLKITKDGTMNRLTAEYSFENLKNYDFTKMLTVLDFINMEIRFKDPLEFVL